MFRSIIVRYLVREIGLALLATLLTLLAIALSHRLAGFLSKAASGLLSKDAIFHLLSLKIVDLSVLLLPLAFLLGIMLALGRLYRDQEMTALAACGQGTETVYRAVLLLAMPLALCTLAINMFLLPTVMEWQFTALDKARKEAEISMFTPGAFREIAGGRHVIYIGALNERELSNIFVRTHENNGNISITTGARGYQETDEQGIRHLILEQGHRYRGIPGNANYDILRFQRALLRIDTEVPLNARLHRETTPTRELLGSPEPKHVAELHLRLNGPMQILLIALWAPLLARTRPGASRYGRIVAAILIYAIYFNLVGIGESWLSRGTVSSAVGLWWVHAVFLIFSMGLWLYEYGVHYRYRSWWRSR